MQRVKLAIQRGFGKAKEVPEKAAVKADEFVQLIRQIIQRIVIFFITAVSLVLASAFIYGSFYFAFVPAPTHQAPIFLGFEPCVDTPTKCGFLNATVSFNMLADPSGGSRSADTPVLMAGQPYTIVVALEMPESPKNLDLGMFMSCLQVKGGNEATSLRVRSQSRPRLFLKLNRY